MKYRGALLTQYDAGEVHALVVYPLAAATLIAALVPFHKKIFAIRCELLTHIRI